ncbi:MAG TPA: NUDIX hydrolase [Anaerolineae bacterium]|nr:NUDIX hydrolase [Anaerolineae bacterium]
MNCKRILALWLHHNRLLQLALSRTVRLLAPRNYIGVMGAIYNDQGQVLLVEHVFRIPWAWGLPGGWVEHGESPAHALHREVAEELNLAIQVKKLLFCEPQVSHWLSTTPKSLGVAYYCRSINQDAPLARMSQATHAYEILSAAWFDPDHLNQALPALQRTAIALGKLEFHKEEALRKLSTA